MGSGESTTTGEDGEDNNSDWTATGLSSSEVNAMD